MGQPARPLSLLGLHAATGLRAAALRIAFEQRDKAIVGQLLMLGAQTPAVAVWHSMLARRRLSSRIAPVSNAVPQTRQTCCSRETCDLSFMTISGCTGGIARNRRSHGAAQQSGVADGRQDASAIGAQPLHGEHGVIR